MHKCLIIKDTVGSLCSPILKLSMVFHPPTSFLCGKGKVTECRKQTRLLWQNVVNGRTETWDPTVE